MTGTTVAGSVIAQLQHVRFTYDEGKSWALDDISLTIHQGERICIVGPNGSGKSTLSRVLAGLVAPDDGSVTLMGQVVCDDESGVNPDAYRAARRSIGAVFQNPEDQLVTTVVEDEVAFGPENLAVPTGEIGHRIDKSLKIVRMASSRHNDPTLMSGGQQQRISIADMLAMDSKVLVLDEPTAMLDPDSRADVLTTLNWLQARGTTLVIVTHLPEDLASATRIVRLEHGHVISDEQQNVTAPDASTAAHELAAKVCSEEVQEAEGVAAEESQLKEHHEYHLICGGIVETTHVHKDDAAAEVGQNETDTDQPIISMKNVSFRYPGAERTPLQAINLDIDAGTSTAIVGENGSGKTTFAKLLSGLVTPTSGSITVAGLPIATDSHTKKPSKRANTKKLRELHRKVGFVMQHPEQQLFAQTVFEDVAFGPRNQGLDENQIKAQVSETLQLLGIEHLAQRSPFELSGGQQRLAAIAGVLACKPSVLVLDEPTAGLDDQASAIIVRVLRELQAQGITILLITHNVALAKQATDHALVLGWLEDNLHKQLELVGIPWDSIGIPTPPSENVGGAPSSTNAKYSWVASLDARSKMLGLLVLMCTAFTMTNWVQLGIGLVAALGLVAAARITPARLWHAIRWFVAMFIFVALLNVLVVHSGTVLLHWGPLVISDEGVKLGVLYALRFTIVVVLGAVLLETTTPVAMTDAFESLMRPFARLGWHVQEVALVMSLALRFLPTLARETIAVRTAQACRGGAVESGNLLARLRALLSIIMSVFAAALRHADTLSLALDARCFEEGLQRTHWRVMRMRVRDWVLLGGVVVICVALWLCRGFAL
ncbi:energy-coupling factor transporter ATPase [Bifidobacterium dolichotidis]